MKKALIMVLLLALTAAISPGAAFSARGPSWQTSVAEVDGCFQVGLRDKNGDMARDYTVQFVVKAPDGRQYRTQRAVKARHDEFVYVTFPRDFQGNLVPGAYVCQFVAGGKAVVTEQFTYQIVQGRGVIQNRQWL